MGTKQKKLSPDDIDLEILHHRKAGVTSHEIGKKLNMASQSVMKRLDLLRAERWLTYDYRLLTEEERGNLMNYESLMIGGKVD